MSLFATISGMAARGYNWGSSAAADGWSVGKDLGATVIHKATDAVGYAGDKYGQAKAYGGQKVDEGVQWAKEKTVAAETSLAQKATRKLLEDKQQRDIIVGKLDKRGRFSSILVQPCPNGATTHPDPRDGQYMGKDCPNTVAERPSQGVKPAACSCSPDGAPFPKVVFSNGINNPAKVVCATMHAIAESRCVEVTGVFNATYADPSLKGPERQRSDYKEAVRAAMAGAHEGASSGGGILGALGLNATGAIAGAAKRALPEVAIQEAARSGVLQDVIDCIKTINQSGAEAASKTLSREIVAALGKNPPDPMTIYLHSQGGLNGGASIAQAKRKLIELAKKSLRDRGLDEDTAEMQASKVVDSRLSKLDVHTFGTLERGLPDGPAYYRYTNELDPVPKAIKEAQASYVPDLSARDPTGAALVTRFKYAPTWNAADAHGMQESYLPWLDQNDTKKPCC
jgi:hypothetical protein